MSTKFEEMQKKALQNSLITKAQKKAANKPKTLSSTGKISENMASDLKKQSKKKTEKSSNSSKNSLRTKQTETVYSEKKAQAEKKSAEKKKKSAEKNKSTKESIKKQINWTLRDIKSDFLPTEERQKVQKQIAKEKAEDYQKKGGFANDKTGQFITGVGEGLVNSSLAGAAYSIKTGKKLGDKLEKGSKNVDFDTVSEKAKSARKAGNVVGEMASYATGYGAAGKATAKAAGKVLSTKAGKKAVEKAAATKVGKKVGEETVKKAAKELTKDAIADATVGTVKDYGLARGEGLESKELAKDMGINAALNIGIGGAVDLVPVAKKVLTKSGKETLRTVAKSADQKDARVVITNMLDKNNNPVLAAIHLGKNGRIEYADEIASVYGKDGYQNFINAAKENGKVLYEDKKIGLDAVPSVGLQLPGANHSSDPMNIIANKVGSVNDNIQLKDLDADTARNTSDIPQSLKQEQPEIKVNSKGEETKVADFDVVGDNTVGIVSPGTESFQEAIEQSTGIFKRFYKAFVNATSEIDNLSKAAGDSRAVNSLQAVKTANGTSDYIFKKHLVNPKGEVIDDRSFIDVFKPVSENSELFNEYAQHLNNIDRCRQGKPLDASVTEQDSVTRVNEILQDHPEFADMTKEINSWWQKVTHSWLVDTGRMTENAWQAMTAKYPNYVPAFMPDKGVNIGGSRFSINAGTKAAKAGTTLKRVPIEDAMMQQIQQMVKTTRKNDLFLNVIDILRNNPDELKHFGVVSNNKQILDNLDFDTIISNSEKEALKEVNSKLYTISAMENGEKVTAYISADLAEAFSKIDNVIGSKNMQAFANLGKKITNAMKGAITVYNPVFSLANISRDIPSALIQTENGTMRYTKNLFKAVGEMATNGEMWNKYLAMGGKSSGYVGSNRTFKNTLLPNKNPIKGAFDNIKNILGAAGEATESVPRFAEFLSTMETTGDLNKALRDSARVTTDFSNAGEVGKLLDAWTLYLNAGIQGLDTFAKTVKTHPLRTAARSTAAITVPFTLLTLYNWDNPHYQDLNDHTKQNYFILPNLAGETDDQGNAKTFIKIPLNREYGAIFGSSIDVIAGYLSGEVDPWNGYANTVQNNFMAADPASENILAPLLINLPNNKDYAGRAIVPTSLENVSPELQYDSSTSGLAKGISKVANNLNIPSDTLKSPMKVDYLLDSYTGYAGQVGQALTDQSLQGTGEHIKGATIDPFIDRFTSDPRYSSGVISDFYDAKEEAEKAYNDVKLTTGEKGQEYIVNKVYSAIQTELSDLSKEEKSVLADNTLSAAEKSERSKEIREQKNEIARGADERVAEAIADYNENPNYAVMDASSKQSYEKKYADVMTKEEFAQAKQIISDAEVTTDAAKAYALASSGMSESVVTAMTSQNAVEKATEYAKAGITLDEIQEASQIVKDSGYTKSVGKAYALLDGGTDATLAEMMTSEKAVQRATWCKKAGVTPEMLDEVAAAIDTNGNGSYTKDEIITFFNHYGGFTVAQKRAIFLSLSSAKNSPY